MVLWRNGFEIGDYGIPRDPNGLYGAQEAFEQAGSPQTLPENGFTRISSILGNVGKVPLSPLCISYGPFVGPIPIQLPINHPWWPLS